MRFYSFLIFLELLDRLGKFIAKTFFIVVYLITSSYIFYVEQFGMQNALENNIFYRPEITIRYLYRYIKWWYKNRQTASLKSTFTLIIAILLPCGLYMGVKYIFLHIMAKISKNICIPEKFNKFTKKPKDMKKRQQQISSTTNQQNSAKKNQ